MTTPKFHCVLGNRDYLQVESPDGRVKRPIWDFIEREDSAAWLTSLVYLRGIQRPAGAFILDCGAWSYKAEAVPRWTPQECVEKYAAFADQGDRVASPDHMVLRGMSPEEELYRVDLTLDNAREFLRICPRDLVPLAVCHGNDLDARLTMLRELLDMGYRSIALGGVAGRAGNRRFVRGVLDSTARLKQEQPFQLHVLGISALSWYREFAEYGVDSYDGSSMFFSAFTAAEYLWAAPNGTLTSYSVRGLSDPSGIPLCACPPCAVMAQQGDDTRLMGGNQRNMGRAVHNINSYLKALSILAGAEPEPVAQQRMPL